MNFLIDANLPGRIVRILQERGHNAVHTLDLPEGNATALRAHVQMERGVYVLYAGGQASL